MSSLKEPLVTKATTSGQEVGTSTYDSSKGPAPPLPPVPKRLRGEAFSTHSDPPPDRDQIQNRVRYPNKGSAYTTSLTGAEDGLDPDPDVDDIFTGNSYATVDFESESFDVPTKSRSHLNLMPAVKQFAIRNGYEVDDEDLELTFRAFFIGGIFALLNAAVNMFFAFRYAGGLAQYWVILVSYPVAKATERLPRGLLNPGPFSPKEHAIIMTIAIAGSLAGTLGLAGGMLALEIFFDTRVR